MQMVRADPLEIFWNKPVEDLWRFSLFRNGKMVRKLPGTIRTKFPILLYALAENINFFGRKYSGISPWR